jgi:hypothetical protein
MGVKDMILFGPIVRIYGSSPLSEKSRFNVAIP